MNSRDTDKFPFGLGSTKSCSLLFQYQLGFILIFALVFNIHGMQVLYFIVVLNHDIGNMYVSGSALVAIFLVKKLIFQNELDYIMLFFLLHKVAVLFCLRINPNTSAFMWKVLVRFLVSFFQSSMQCFYPFRHENGI